MILRSLCLNRLALAGLVAIVGVVFTAQAHARTELLRWTHTRPGDVQDFRIHIRNQDGSDPQFLSINVPARDSRGVFFISVEIGEGDKLVSMRAIGPNGVQSAWSQPQLRAAPAPVPLPAPPTTPTTPPTPPTTPTTPTTPVTPATPTTPPTEVGPEPEANVSPVGPGILLAATNGAAQRYDFENNAKGSTVDDWRETAKGYSLVVDNSQFAVVSLGSNHVLRSNTGDANAHAHAANASDSWSNYEVRGRMAVDSSEAGIGVTTYSQFSSDDAYYRLGREPNGEFLLQARPFISCSNASTGVTPNPGEWYRYKLFVQDIGGLNRISAKIWNERSPEPDKPQAICEHASTERLRGGRIGAWTGIGEGQRYWDDFEVVLSDGGNGTEPLAPPILILVSPVQR